ncbi:hypothetical protein N1851_024504 [Merluccius polli]|uniref:Uncharacterized protein n=1 Tax=Merluccius polli TaxID=89951 RepID=A0AA47MEY3_MERPO|nr:hypothetical protein N1851_024504 [Merluccius polli]
MSPKILSNFYNCIVESKLTNCITVWYGSTTAMDCIRLQRMVETAEKITRTPLPSAEHFHILKDPTHPQHGPFTLPRRCHMCHAQIRSGLWEYEIKLPVQLSASPLIND